MLPTINIFSLFPEAVDAVLSSSILRRAQAKGLVDLGAKNIRDFSENKHKSVDDSPYSGKQGMLMMAPVLDGAMAQELAELGEDRSRLKVIMTSPRGLRLEQPVAEQLGKWLLGGVPEAPRRIVVACGRYEGIDERFVEKWVDMELSLGDFILSGGEIAALALCDAVVRLLPGVLGNEKSAQEDSFSKGLLEYPQYTRPREWAGMSVPEDLSGGNHGKAEQWQLRQALLLTAAFRPDLLLGHQGEGLPAWAQDLLEILKKRCAHRT